MLRYGSRRIRKHLTMRMPKKINNKITKTNVVFCSRDMLESDAFPKGTRGEGMGCPPSIIQRLQSTEFPGSPLFHHQFAEIMVAAPWRGCVIFREKERKEEAVTIRMEPPSLESQPFFSGAVYKPTSLYTRETYFCIIPENNVAPLHKIIRSSLGWPPGTRRDEQRMQTQQGR